MGLSFWACARSTRARARGSSEGSTRRRGGEKAAAERAGELVVDREGALLVARRLSRSLELIREHRSELDEGNLDPKQRLLASNRTLDNAGLLLWSHRACSMPYHHPAAPAKRPRSGGSGIVDGKWGGIWCVLSNTTGTAVDVLTPLTSTARRGRRFVRPAQPDPFTSLPLERLEQVRPVVLIPCAS